MTTPILDFVRRYAASGTSRLHMPGHKGEGPLGCEAIDLTEISGADELYEPSGIIAESEINASSLFGSRKTVYSTEGATQCIKAMLYLAYITRGDRAPTVLAARNAHKALIFAAAELGIDIDWLWSESKNSLCECVVTPEGLDRALSGYEAPPCAVYITSPDYLGRRLDGEALAAVCHRHGTLFIVDNAHGAYLPFVEDSKISDCADMWCSSAHKTLPVLTGGAYLHLGKSAPEAIAPRMKSAMAIFGSSSPSYLTLASLDACNAFLAGDGAQRLRETAAMLGEIKRRFIKSGWTVVPDEPLKLTVNASARGLNGLYIADHLRSHGIEPEYAEPDYIVLMVTPATKRYELDAVVATLEELLPECTSPREPYELFVRPERVMSPREAILSLSEEVTADYALGRVCAAPTVGCPPAVPIVVSGERIDAACVKAMKYYGIERVRVL